MHPCGTPRYTAPEITQMIKNKQRTEYNVEKVDIFSLGITLFTLTYQALPYKEVSDENLAYKCICSGDWDQFW